MKRQPRFQTNKHVRPLRRWLFVLYFVFGIHFILSAQSIPKWKINDLVNYINKSDSIVVVNFWATWCKPCVEELPGIIRATKKYPPGKAKLLLVSLDLKKDYPSKIDSFVKANQIANKIVWLDETNADYFCPKIDSSWSGSLPATLIYNAHTKKRKFFEGALSEEKFTIELNSISSVYLPKPSGYVNDMEKIFNQAQIDTLESIIDLHRKKTGDEIAIVTISNFAPYKNINDFSLNLANNWGLGQKHVNNGVMIVFGSQIRQIRIQNGKGITGRLTDSETQKIIDETFIPYFRKNEFYNGAKSGLVRLIEELQKKAGK